jgi:hypothetical protein
MKIRGLPIAVSLVALLLAVGHLLFPAAKIDAVMLALLAIAILPWLGSIFKSVELPGGLKVQYQELKQAEEKAEQAGLLMTPTPKEESPAFIAIAEQDPNLALAGLRIEIEKRLRAIGASLGLKVDVRGIAQLMRELRKAQAISQNDESVLRDLIGLLNDAVHGADVDQRSAQWAIEVGPQLLAALDSRISSP